LLLERSFTVFAAQDDTRGVHFVCVWFSTTRRRFLVQERRQDMSARRRDVIANTRGPSRSGVACATRQPALSDQSHRPQDSNDAASVQTPDLVSPRTTTIMSRPGREPLAIRQCPAASV